MNIVVAMDNKNGIGKDGDLLFHFKEDMKRFKELTLYKTVVMGRKTLESLPNSKPLKDRSNIILTRQEDYPKGDYIVISNLSLIKQMASPHLPNISKNLYLIGGGEIYNQLINYCDTAYITVVDNDFNADTFFPDIFNNKDWSIIEESDNKITEIKSKEYNYKFYTLKNNNVKTV